MYTVRTITLLTLAGLSACAAPAPLPVAGPGWQPSFAQFGEDEDACRREGTAAIRADAASDAAAHQYDYAYQRCMFLHGRSRQMNAMANSDAPPPGNVHSLEYPDAFFSVPYATPGYGYDGFSYR